MPNHTMECTMKPFRMILMIVAWVVVLDDAIAVVRTAKTKLHFVNMLLNLERALDYISPVT